MSFSSQNKMKQYPQWLRAAARKGGKAKSEKKSASSAKNGKLGGRPRKKQLTEEAK